MVQQFYDDESVKKNIGADGYFRRDAFSADHQGIANVGYFCGMLVCYITWSETVLLSLNLVCLFGYK